MKKKIIIISYHFHPSSKIGAKRWSKFSRYLTKGEYDVEVITSSEQNNNKTGWNDESIFNSLNITRLKNESTLSSLIRWNPKNFLEKTVRRILIFSFSCMCIDEAQGWCFKVGNFLNKYQSINAETKVIVSVAPFSLLFLPFILSKKYKKNNLICDIRDIWNNKQSNFNNRPRLIKFFEKLCLRKFNYLITVSNTLKKVMLVEHNFKKENILVLYNGFDSNNGLPEEKIIQIPNENILNITYAGSLSFGRKKKFLEFLNFLIDNNNQIKTRFKKKGLRVNYFGSESFDSSFKTFFEEKLLVNHGSASHKDVLLFQAQSDINLVINSERFSYIFKEGKRNFAVSSKLFELLNLKKNIFILSNSGAISELCEKEKFNFVTLSDSPKIDDFRLRVLDEKLFSNLDKFSYKEQSKLLMNFIS